jgi:hypothetical protein
VPLKKRAKRSSKAKGSAKTRTASVKAKSTHAAKVPPAKKKTKTKVSRAVAQPSVPDKKEAASRRKGSSLKQVAKKAAKAALVAAGIAAVETTLAEVSPSENHAAKTESERNEEKT